MLADLKKKYGQKIEHWLDITPDIKLVEPEAKHVLIACKNSDKIKAALMNEGYEAAYKMARQWLTVKLDSGELRSKPST